MFIYEHVYHSKIVLFLKGRQHNVLNETILKGNMLIPWLSPLHI